MSDTTRLDDLLLRWEELYERGEDVPAEELCRDCPELAGPLAERVAELKRVRWLNASSCDASLPPTNNLSGRREDHSPQWQRESVTEVTVGDGVELLPGYRLIRRLGAGGFGQVWEAETRSGGRSAVKIIPGVPGLNGLDKAEVELAGLQRMMGVRSPWKLWTAFYEVVGSTLIVVSDLADGTLRDHLRSREGPAEDALAECVSLLRDVADFLDLLNIEHEMVHGDIKPNNMLMMEGVCVVADFGCVIPLGLRPMNDGVFVCSASEAGRDLFKTVAYRSPREVPWRQIPSHRASLVTNVGCFTPDYAPPEAFEGRSSRTFDQYSLALTFCDVAFGRLPFTGTLEDQLAQRRLGVGDVYFLPEPLRLPVSRALSPDPEQRFATCQEFTDAIRDACLPLVRHSPGAEDRLAW